MPPRHVVLNKTLAVWVLALVAGSAYSLDFTDAYVRGLPPGQKNTAAFFTVSNESQRGWDIAGVTSNAAATVEIHEHVARNGMMQMRELASLTVPAGGEITFAPGGLHLMLIGLARPLAEGEAVELTFTAADGATETVTFPVISVINEHKHHH